MSNSFIFFLSVAVSVVYVYEEAIYRSQFLSVVPVVCSVSYRSRLAVILFDSFLFAALFVLSCSVCYVPVMLWLLVVVLACLFRVLCLIWKGVSHA